MTESNDLRMKWNATFLQVMESMKNHITCFITPISKVIAHDHGEHLGSGAYFMNDRRRFLITNEHVARQLKSHSIGRMFHGSNDVFRSLNPMFALEYPNDVALAVIEDKVWVHSAHQATPIPISRFATSHKSVKGELFFIAGYSGERSRFVFGTLFSGATPYLTQEMDVPDKCGDSEFHFALEYLPDKAIPAEAGGHGLPDPHGFSGSLVWNTRFVETGKLGMNWSPDCAQVTGIVWGWPSGSGCLIATKAEHLQLPFLMKEACSSKT